MEWMTLQQWGQWTRKKNQYLPRKRQKHKYSSNMDSSKGHLRELNYEKFLCGHHPKLCTQIEISLIWCAEWATLIERVSLPFESALGSLPVSGDFIYGVQSLQIPNSSFFGGKKLKNWPYNFRMLALYFFFLIFAYSCGKKIVALILQ